MEAANIDWTTVESEYVCDEFYEHIEAPKWLDLSVPSPPVDDEAWFCRPNCRHPKNAEDFKRWSPSPKAKPTRENAESIPMPLGERNRKNQSSKKKGGILRTKDNAKNFVEDLENQNPNFSPSSSTRATPSRLAKVLKEAVKSSAEKKVAEKEETESKKKPLPRLKSTLSARNLFSGRDILGQILEFCSEIKKMAVGREKTNLPNEEAKEEEEDNKVLLESPPKKNDAAAKKKSSRSTVRVGSEGENYDGDGDVKSSSVLKEVRACPPTPQRFHSPSGHPLRGTKPLKNNNNKLPKSSPVERGILQDLDRISEEKRTLVKKNENLVGTSDAEGSSVDMFWFFKPCTHLVK